jgi:hypothetical protein
LQVFRFCFLVYMPREGSFVCLMDAQVLSAGSGVSREGQ